MTSFFFLMGDFLFESFVEKEFPIKESIVDKYLLACLDVSCGDYESLIFGNHSNSGISSKSFILRELLVLLKFFHSNLINSKDSLSIVLQIGIWIPFDYVIC